jgi:hypothetical protein
MITLDPQVYLDQLAQLAAEERRREATYTAEARGAAKAAEAYEAAARALIALLQPPAPEPAEEG